MDSEDFRSILESVDVWAFMDAAIAVASVNHADELKRRRDRIVELGKRKKIRICGTGLGGIG